MSGKEQTLSASGDAASARLGRGQRAIDHAERFGLIATWVLLIAIFGAINPDTFLTWASRPSSARKPCWSSWHLG